MTAKPAKQPGNDGGESLHEMAAYCCDLMKKGIDFEVIFESRKELVKFLDILEPMLDAAGIEFHRRMHATATVNYFNSEGKKLGSAICVMRIRL